MAGQAGVAELEVVGGNASLAERGVQSVGGLVMEASSLETDRMLRDGLVDFAFTLPFATVPGVFASVTTYNDAQAVTLRVADRTALGFRMTMQAEEAAVAHHGFERLDWIAIQSGEGSTSNGRRLRVFDTSVAQPAFEMGCRAAALLLQRLDDPTGERVVEMLEPTLVVRGSTAPLPAPDRA